MQAEAPVSTQMCSTVGSKWYTVSRPGIKRLNNRASNLPLSVVMSGAMAMGGGQDGPWDGFVIVATVWSGKLERRERPDLNH